MSRKLSLVSAQHVARLAALPLGTEELNKLLPQLSKIVEFVSGLQKKDSKDVPITSQVTSLCNVFREDKVEAERMLSQEEALKNAPHIYKGYFKVPAVLED